jgi:hypothetical protein
MDVKHKGKACIMGWEEKGRQMDGLKKIGEEANRVVG